MLINDNGCGWINDLDQRQNLNILNSKINCEWLIIGAGYTGLSAARKLGQLYPDHNITIVDLILYSIYSQKKQRTQRANQLLVPTTS